ncbi:MAG TPA: HAMP domain-containing sensor histidine kinase [Chloroflexota bacterium]|nr:HAMP domain-containing sensor histidine kinase [Chloroflexota bacterium]
MSVFSRLRWRLTLSHLLATGFTLVSMIGAVLLIGSTWFATQGNTSREPANDARNVAAALGGMIESGADSAQLNAVVRPLADGSLRTVFGFAPSDRRWGPSQVGLSGVAYIVIVNASGAVLASSQPSGAAFAPPEQAAWQGLTASADSSGSMVVLPAGASPAALGAAAINDASGRRLATVIVATTSPPTAPGSGGLDLAHGLAFFGAASLAVLAAASLFALVSSSIVAYLLSRGLIGRLEGLGQAAESLAAGDLSRRVKPGTDEVGQLARRFNNMADDLQQTLNELRAERDRVAGLLEDRRQLVASASHELRTPVATVRGYLESALGRAERLPDELHSDLATMQRELARLQQLIDDLFALSQAAVGRLSLRLEPTDARAVVQRLVETNGPLAWRQRRVEVLAEVASETPPARADRQRLEQVLSNLLGNAIRHTPPGGLVAAAVTRDDGVVRIDVRDTGEGIGEEDLPHVFERFYRGHTPNGGTGAGLGLALVKELTEAMGGTVEASSTPGEGSCFSVRLPRA